ncbi:putative Armadillo-like helical protein, partial [Pseudoloma neurophilia]
KKNKNLDDSVKKTKNLDDSEQKSDMEWTPKACVKKILPRAKDIDERLRKIVVKNLIIFYEHDQPAILKQLLLSLRDPKYDVQSLALSHIKTIFQNQENKDVLAEQLLEQVNEFLLSKTQQDVSDLLFDYFVSKKDEKIQLYVLSKCSNEKISIFLKDLKKKYKHPQQIYHFLYHNCTSDIFERLKLQKKQQNDYFNYVLKYFTESEKCCSQENCHLLILVAIGYKNLENILELLKVIKENRENTKIIVEYLYRLKSKVFVSSQKTAEIIRLLANSPQNHYEEFFILLKNLESNFKPLIDEILPNIKHKKLIKFFNTPPIDNAGVIYQGLWNIRDKNFDRVDNLKFFKKEDHVQEQADFEMLSQILPQNDFSVENAPIHKKYSAQKIPLKFDVKKSDISEYTEVLTFLIEEIRTNESKIVSQDGLQMISCMKSILIQSINHISLQMDDYIRNGNFYDFLVTFLCFGYFTFESTYLYESPSHLKTFVKKCKDLPLVLDVGLNFLISTNNKKISKEITGLIAQKIKNKPSNILFNKMKDLVVRKVDLMKICLFVDFLSLEERIILESMTEGELKTFLKNKCTE